MAQPALFYKSVTIVSGQTTSPAIDLQDFSLVAIDMPAAFTGANISFVASTGVNDGAGGYAPTTYKILNLGTTALSYAVAASRYVSISDFIPARFIKIVSDASEGGDRVLNLTLKPI